MLIEIPIYQIGDHVKLRFPTQEDAGKVFTVLEIRFDHLNRTFILTCDGDRQFDEISVISADDV